MKKNEARPQAFVEFESLAATIPEIVYRINEEGNFTYLNPAIRTLGYSPEELIGKHFSELILPADVKSVSRKHILPWFLGKAGSRSPKLFDERRGVERKTSQLEVRLLSKGGARAISGKIKDIGSHQIIAEVSSSGVYRSKTGSQDGVFLGTVGIISDITSQRWMEAELIRYSRELEKQIKESKEISTVILDSSPIGLFIVSNNEFQFANKSFLKITGYNLEQLKGRNVLDLVAPEDRETVRLSAIGMLKHGISYPYEYKAVDINKNIHWIRETVASIHYNGKRAILGNFIDVTDRKKAEEALRKSEENLRASMDNSPAGILIATHEAKELYANKAFFSDIYGYSSLEELVSVPFEERLTAESLAFFKTKIEQVKQKGFVPDRHEVSIIRKDGEVRYLLLSVAEVLWKGSPQIQMAYQDITERKLAEDRINRLNEVLRTIRKINELIVEIEDENELLQKACLALANGRSYKLARIGFIQEDSYDVKPVAQAGFATDYFKSLKVTWDNSEYGRNPSGMAIKTGKPVVIQDVDTDENFRFWRDTASKYGFASVAALPLTVRDKVIGMLAVYSETRGVFNEDEIDLLKELAGDISLGITKIRQRIETARSEAKYAALVENSNDGIIILQDARVKFTNTKLGKMTGYGVSENIGKPFIDFVSPAYQELVIEHHKKRTAGEAVPNRYEADILTRDGKPLPVEINASLVEYEGKPAIMAIIRDITERKIAEEALRKSEENHRNSLDQSPAGIIISDANYKITYANHAFLNMHGYSSIEEFKAVSPGKIEESANPQFLAALKEIKEGRQPKESSPNRGEITVKRKNGEVRYLSVSLAKIFWSGIQQAQLVFLDITELKKAEQQLKESYETLQRTFDGVVKVISAAVELRDPYTAGHQLRVAQLARAIAGEMNLTEERADQIYTASLIHDIGKISIPAEILSKPGTLNSIELSLIQMHPKAGYDILNNINFPYPVARWVLEHHERINGSGYPNGLKAEQISIEAKILAVADVVEAMASHRPYRPSLTSGAALEEIVKNKGILYDSNVVDACLKLFYEKGFKLDITV